MSIAIVIYVLGIFALSRPFVSSIALILAPGMVLGLAEPNSPGSIAVLLAIVFVTNFVLYGAIGVVCVWTWSRFRYS